MRCHALSTCAPLQAKADKNRLVAPTRRFGAEQRAEEERSTALPAGPCSGFSFADVPVHAPPAPATGQTGLPEPLKAGVERLSGLAMDDVRVHRDSPEPARLGALAFARGSDIHLGPGQGRHLPHEAWHVVQQKQGRVTAAGRLEGVEVNNSATLEAEADCAALQIGNGSLAKPAGPLSQGVVRERVVQRKEPENGPSLEDSETALGTILRGPEHASGFKLAFYDEGEPEAERRASDFATRENALGFSGKKPTAAAMGVGRAVAGVFGIETTTLAIADVVAAALARVPADPTLPAAAAAAPGKIKTIAIFAHGTPTWCSAGVTTGNAGSIFKKITSKLASDVTVILYTCNSARGTDEDEEWVKGTMEGGGKGSLAELVRDTLVEQKVDAATVWGHTTTGHTSRNPALRLFEASAGKGAAGESYVTKYVFTDTEKTAAIGQIATAIDELGYSVSSADPKFLAAAAKVLRAKFYSAYIEANKNLKGDNVAEDAPNYPNYTASRVESYWTDTYWPRERKPAAEAVIKALKLKKPAPTSK